MENVDSHTGNHPEDDSTPLETIRRLCSIFGRRSHLGFEGETSEPKGRLIAELSTLTAPVEKKELIVYLADAQEAVSVMLITEREAKQMLVYFASRALPRISVKGQILADFIVERPKDDPRAALIEVEEELLDPWRIFAHLTKQVLVEELNEKSINEAEVLAIVEEEGNTWMTPIYEYLKEETLPAKRKKARAARLKSRRYTVIDGVQSPFSNHGYGKIVSDNGKQFRDDPFKDWCEKPDIRQHFTSVKHQQANGLGEWVKAQDTPFSMTYGTKAIIPAEIGMPTLWTVETNMVQNDEALELNLDLLEEKMEQAAICEARSKEKMEKYYNSKVHSTRFNPKDLVYRKNDASHAEDGGKLGPN
ncbi:reverse transcriptase domain-containing protein [Tanacetum coccineum]